MKIKFEKFNSYPGDRNYRIVDKATGRMVGTLDFNEGWRHPWKVYAGGVCVVEGGYDCFGFNEARRIARAHFAK